MTTHTTTEPANTSPVVVTTASTNQSEAATSAPVAAHILEEKVTLLESIFNTIYSERMKDIPIINDKVEVRVIGFQQWQNSYLCIMITPWFMNLMLLPGDTENWDDQRETASIRHAFPSGNYNFLVGFEPNIGKYQMCSLFSPMFEFADNDAAVETAEAAIKELMKLENIEKTDIDTRQIKAIWDGSEEHPDKIAAKEKAETLQRVPLKEKMQEPLSRRHLLRSALMLDNDKKTE